MIKRGLIGALLCAILLVPAVVVQAHKPKTKTVVKLQKVKDNPHPGTVNSLFSGGVRSKKAECKRDRDLKVILKQPGHDQITGSGHTDDTADNGPTTYAIVGKTEVAGSYFIRANATSKCERDVSNSVHVPAS